MGREINPVRDAPPPKGSRKSVVLVLVIAVLIIGAALLSGSYLAPLLSRSSNALRSSSVSSVASLSSSTGSADSSSTSSTSTSQPNSYHFTPANPEIGPPNGTIVSYPLDYDKLANYTLALINTDRAQAHLSNVSLSTIQSGQQHADSEDYFGYSSHWDTQGYKPYMRYTLLGGRGAVSENVAVGYCTDSGPSFGKVAPCNLQTVENALTDSEWDMMNNDSTCCGNGHRADILNPFHNQVSLGIAYNTTSSFVYLVEDFENVYIGFSQLSYGTSEVLVQATSNTSLSFPQGYGLIDIYFDPSPQATSVGFNSSSPELPPFGSACYNGSCPGATVCGGISEENETVACEYWGGYNAGTVVGIVAPPCPSGFICPGTTKSGLIQAYATTWSHSNESFSIQFPLSAFVEKYGSGVYTMYMWNGNDSNDTIMSYSMFIQSASSSKTA